MKLNNLAIAMAVMCGGVATQASAQATFQPFDAPSIKVFLSGASAPDNFLESIATGLFQESATNPIYRYVAVSGGSGAYRAFFGRVKTDASIPAAIRGQTVLLVKRSRGGSVWGVNPVARADRIAVLDVSATSCTAGAGTLASPYQCAAKGIDPGLPNHTNPSNPGEVPDVGVSDVSPELFKAPYNVEFGQTALSASEAARLTIKPINVLMMGIAATNAVPDTTVLSRSNYGAMLSGLYQDWSQVDPSITSGNTGVVVCRRVQGSGTQASYNWFFNNFPCQNQFSGVVAPTRMVADSASGVVSGTGTELDPFIIDPTQGYTVVENPGSGDVRNCLARAGGVAVGGTRNHKFQGDNGSWYQINFGNSSDPFRAVGVLSADSFSSAFPNVALSVWSFRNIDGAGVYNLAAQTPGTGPGTGVAPSKANLVSGRWDFGVEVSSQYRKAAVTNVFGDNVAALAGTKKTFVDEFIKRAGDPTFNNVPHTAALPPTFDPTSTANVAKGTRFANMCSPLQLLY